MLHITKNAAQQIQALGDQPLRLSIVGGGCAGFQYIFELSEQKDTDIIFTKDGAMLIIDAASLALVDGSTIDFTKDLMGERFVIQNPNATVSCGCGSSFTSG